MKNISGAQNQIHIVSGSLKSRPYKNKCTLCQKYDQKYPYFKFPWFIEISVTKEFSQKIFCGSRSLNGLLIPDFFENKFLIRNGVFSSSQSKCLL